MTTVLALDLARGRTGWALLYKDDSEALHLWPVLIGSGLIETPAHERVRETRGGHLRRQYQAFTEELNRVLGGVTRNPSLDMIAYEYPSRPRHAHWKSSPGQRGPVTAGSEFNAMQAIALAEGWLVAWAATDWPDLPLVAISVEDAKRFVTRNPNAAKELVARRLMDRWHLDRLIDMAPDGTMRYDRSDAASVGLCALYGPGTTAAVAVPPGVRALAAASRASRGRKAP